MSAEMLKEKAGEVFGAIHNAPDVSSPTPSNAKLAGGRSFSQILKTPITKLSELFRGPASLPKASHCVICSAGHDDIRRLAQIVGRLPVGQKVQLPKVRDGLDANFKTVVADLEYMISELRLPIEFSRRGVLLKEPVHLCPRCVRNAAY